MSANSKIFNLEARLKQSEPLLQKTKQLQAQASNRLPFQWPYKACEVSCAIVNFMMFSGGVTEQRAAGSS